MQSSKNAELRETSSRADTSVSTGNPFWDMMLSLGKASSQALTAYAGTGESGQRSERSEHGVAHRAAAEVEVIALGEETLNVGTRQVQGETTRVRRVVVETPVEREVALREERVVVERRKPTAATTATEAQGILSETAVEMTDTYEVVEAWKSARVVEEVVLRREVTERTERVRDTVRRDEVAVEHASRAPTPRQPTAEPRDVAPHVLRPDADAAPHDAKLIVPAGALDQPKASAPAPRAEQDKAGSARKD